MDWLILDHVLPGSHTIFGTWLYNQAINSRVHIPISPQAGKSYVSILYPLYVNAVLMQVDLKINAN